MSLPLVTRFGANPTVPLEVANKAYVDAGGGGSSLVFMPRWGDQTDTALTTDFGTINGRYINFTTSGNQQSSYCPVDGQFSNMIQDVTTNSMDDVVLISIFNRTLDTRGCTLTITASTTGVFTNHTDTFDALQNAEMLIEYNRTSPTAGSLRLRGGGHGWTPD